MSLCNTPSISIPIPTFDALAIIEAMLALLGITLPAMPTFTLPPPFAPFCPLD